MRHIAPGLAAALASLIGLLAPAAHAADPSAVYVFGDSLSDNGNLAEKVFRANFYNPPSYHDSFTNGVVAMGLLTQSYGLAYNPSLWANGFVDQHNLFGPGFVAGNNYAVAGATAANRGAGGLFLDLPYQVSAFVSHVGGAAPSSALYAMLIGGNDVRNAAHALDPSLAQNGVASELTQLQNLIDAGAQHLLVSNLPDVGLTPEFTSGPASQDQAAHDDTLLYDSSLLAGVEALRAANPNATIGYFDLFSYSNSVLGNAASLGFTNTTDACYTSAPYTLPVTASPGCGPVTATGAANIDQYVFWDDVHPTARVDQIWAQGLIAAAVPEPATWASMLVGLTLVGTARRRRSR